MKRAVTAIVATVAGVAWLVTYRVTPHHQQVAAVAPPVSSTPAAAGSSPAPTTPGGGQAAPAPSPSPAPGGAFTGSLVPTIYGDVQVSIVVSGNRVTDVKAVQLPYDRARSEEISQFVEPILRSEAIKAQNAQIDVISGATFTSEAYAESLAGALQQAHLA